MVFAAVVAAFVASPVTAQDGYRDGDGYRGNDSYRGGDRYPGGGYPGGGYGPPRQQIACSSRDYATVRCPADTRRGVRLVRQTSNSACVQGRSWGYDRGGVWVNGGCRAVFVVN